MDCRTAAIVGNATTILLVCGRFVASGYSLQRFSTFDRTLTCLVVSAGTVLANGVVVVVVSPVSPSEENLHNAYSTVASECRAVLGTHDPHEGAMRQEVLLYRKIMCLGR